jgi:hypothetical protein
VGEDAADDEELLPYEAKLFEHCDVLLLLQMPMISKREKKFLRSNMAPLPACLPQILYNFYCSLFGA